MTATVKGRSSGSTDAGGARPAHAATSPSRQGSGRQRRLEKARSRPPTRFAVVYDVAGPRVRLGVLWFAVLAGALALGLAAVTAVYSIVALYAGLQTAQAWRRLGHQPNELVAALIGGAIPVGAALGPAAAGIVVLAGVPIAFLVATSTRQARHHTFANTGFTLQSGVFIGLAAAAPVLSYRVGVGAAVALVLFVSVYECGDYLVGSGSTNSIEGPVAGMAAIGVCAFAMWVAPVPPFRGDAILAFGGLAACLCPVGQVVGSALLPRADAHAPALRRLDSLLVLGPAWVFTLWTYLEIVSV